MAAKVVKFQTESYLTSRLLSKPDIIAYMEIYHSNGTKLPK